jgi:2-polyprenyl-3-methyl-5-hydroxy-6-metoxy-1,4-benzoquinol methylase
LEINPKFENDKIKLIAHNLDNPLPFDEGHFDYVTLLAILEHLGNPEEVMRELHRVLKPGGTLFITTPTIYAKPVLEFMAFKLGIISREEIRDHKRYFTKKDLEDICRKVGFSEYKYHYFQFYLNGFLRAKK